MAKLPQKELKRITAVVSGLGKCGRWHEALKLARRYQGDTALQNAAMQAAAEGGLWQEAAHILQRMRSAGPSPDLMSFSSMVTAFSRGQHLARALHFVAQTQEEGWSSDLVPFSALIGACAAHARWEEAVQGLGRLSGEASAPLAARLAAISACARARRWQLALALRGADKDVRLFGAAVHAADCGRNWQLALGLKQEMSSEHLAVNTVAMNSVLSCLAKAGRWQLVLCLLEDMPKEECQPDVITFNSAISACERGWHWPAALQLFTKMRKDRVKISVLSVNGLLSAFEKGRKWPEALALLQRSARRRLQLTQVSFNAAASACEKSLQWRRALLLTHQVLRAPAQDLIATAVSISACEKGLAWELALQLASRVPHDPASLATALGAAEKASQWQQAMAMLQRHAPGALALGAAHVRAAGRSLRWQLAFHSIWESQLQQPFDDMALSAACSAAAATARWEAALALADSHPRLPIAAASATVDACQRARQWRAALALAKPAGLLGLMAAAAVCERTTCHETSTRRSLALRLWKALLADELWPAHLRGVSVGYEAMSSPLQSCERVCSVMIILSADAFQDGSAGLLALRRAYMPLRLRLLNARLREEVDQVDPWLRLTDGLGPLRSKTSLSELGLRSR
ncbi:unnamed protein product [Effrenium voratum]|uniref:Pentatricopeptide repeat-containing protein, chloroplastic n=1 Tax=Effrenium voratum TaxID=2562239 RepID=A0AA36NFI0_9DINO|nr:unnamed protein product [Effrenium voratum]